MSTKTSITIEDKIRAAYDAMHVEVPGLTLSEFFDQAATFYLAYKDEASFRPLVKHLGAISEQLTHVAAPPPANQSAPPGRPRGQGSHRAAHRLTTTPATSGHRLA